MWPLISPRAKRISSPEKFWSSLQKDFFNTICQKQTSDIGKDESDALLSMPINVDRSSEKPSAAILILHPPDRNRDCADTGNDGVP
jgi:hypothetical protein